MVVIDQPAIDIVERTEEVVVDTIFGEIATI
jgi:hypothetical protein